jgi:hypothetical protein
MHTLPAGQHVPSRQSTGKFGSGHAFVAPFGVDVAVPVGVGVAVVVNVTVGVGVGVGVAPAGQPSRELFAARMIRATLT